MTIVHHETLAIDGGTPVRTAAFHPWPLWDEREEQALLRALHSGQWGIGGAESEAFEQELATAIGTTHALAVTTGTSALIACLRGAGIGYGDEVIVPPYTFIATASAVLLVGAVPIFADIDPATYTMDPAAIEPLITPRTRAVMPVHIGGLPADMDAINAIAKRHNLLVIEDACQSIGAQWNGKLTGSLADMGTFSFQSSKNINSGEGGAITTNNAKLWEGAWSYKNCGRVRGGAWYRHDTLGDNLRLSQFQSAILRAQLTRMEELAERRRINGDYLVAGLAQIDGLTPQYQDPRVTRHGYHLIIGRYHADAFGGWSRERFLKALNAEGIPSSPGYVPISATGGIEKETAALCHALGRSTPAINCPVNDRICVEEAVWICGQAPLLGERGDMDDILTAIAKVQAASRE